MTDSQLASVTGELLAADQASGAGETIPRGVRIAGGWAWRLLAVAAVIVGLSRVVSTLAVVAIPVAVAVLLAALLDPLAGRLRRRGLPRSLAALGVLVLGLAAVGVTLFLVARAFINGLPDLTDQLTNALNKARDWLSSGPLNLSNDDIDSYVKQAQEWLSSHSSTLTSGAISTATTIGELATGFLVVLFSTFFFLKDGREIWHFLTRLLPRAAREPVRTAGEHSWHTLSAYVRATVLVAFVDAIGIGIGLVVLGVPLPLPLAALVFIGAFIPVVGAALSGAVSVVVATVAVSPVAGVILLCVVIAVQQLEGHVLQPLIMGRAVALHPLAVIVAIASGIVIAGIVGGLFAVPLLAVLNTGIRSLLREHPA
jgi:predicted PurR-regulated permease PerM